MDIELLNEFFVLSKSLNYSKTAEQLYMSQSVLSRHIQNLENQLGVELFRRTKHSVELTHIGSVLAKDIEPIITQYAQAMNHVHMFKNGALGSIEIIASYTLSALFAYDFLPEFNKKYPGIQIHMSIEEPGPMVKQNILENKTDVTIMLDWTDNVSSDIGIKKFFKNHFFVFIADTHPLAQKNQFTIEELSNIPMVYLSPRESLCSIPYFEKIFTRHNAVYNPAVPATSIEDLFVKVLKGDGLSILSEPVFKYAPARIKKIRITSPDAYIDTNLIYNKKSTNASIPVFVHEFSLFTQAYQQQYPYL